MNLRGSLARPISFPAGRVSASQNATLWIVSAGIFMTILDLFIVNIAFPDIRQDFDGSTLSQLSWILNGYAIVFAALLVPAGRFADQWGQKRVFVAGLTLFTLASGLCALATGPFSLVIARLLQAAGAAALTPTSLALLLNAVSIERRPWALGIWTAVGAMAAAAGPTAGGILVTLSWRWVFLVNVPVGVITIALATSLLSEHRGEKSAAGPDLLGSLLLTLAIGSLALGIVEGPDWGWSSGRVAGALITSVILVGWFVRRTLRHPSPIIEPAMVRVRSFAVASIAALFFNAAFSIMLLGLVQYMTDLWGYSAMRTGLAISPGPIMVRMIAPRAQSLVQRWGSTAVATLGTGLLFAGAMVWYLRTGTERAYVTDLLPGLILGGTGFGLTLPVLLTTAARSLPPQRFATGSAVITMARQIGTVLGVSLLVVLLDSGTHGSIVAIHRGWLAMAGAALVAAGFSLFLTGRTRPSVALATNR